MAYLELSKEAYNDIIMAAGMKGSKVAMVCRMQGDWSEEAMAEAPPDAVVERTPMTTYTKEDTTELNSSMPVPDPDDEAPVDPLMDSSDD